MEAVTSSAVADLPSTQYSSVPHRTIKFSRNSSRQAQNGDQSDGSERIIQFPGCDDCTVLGHDTNLVSASVVVARLGAGVSKVPIDSVKQSSSKKICLNGSWSGFGIVLLTNKLII